MEIVNVSKLYSDIMKGLPASEKDKLPHGLPHHRNFNAIPKLGEKAGSEEDKRAIKEFCEYVATQGPKRYDTLHRAVTMVAIRNRTRSWKWRWSRGRGQTSFGMRHGCR